MSELDHIKVSPNLRSGLSWCQHHTNGSIWLPLWSMASKLYSIYGGCRRDTLSLHCVEASNCAMSNLDFTILPLSVLLSSFKHGVFYFYHSVAAIVFFLKRLLKVDFYLQFLMGLLPNQLFSKMLPIPNHSTRSKSRSAVEKMEPFWLFRHFFTVVLLLNIYCMR